MKWKNFVLAFLSTDLVINIIMVFFSVFAENYAFLVMFTALDVSQLVVGPRDHFQTAGANAI